MLVKCANCAKVIYTQAAPHLCRACRNVKRCCGDPECGYAERKR